MPKPKRRIRRTRTAQEIAAILAAFDRSGQSAAAFARTRPMSLSTLRFWLRRRRGVVTVPKLVPVKVIAAPMAAAPTPPIEIVCQREPKIPQVWELKIPHPQFHCCASAS
ncbi:MAG TPA: hypothetical protein VEC57_03125 [Candidatus Limnocylindrales bacterium]|nr:hypothetical protein [Candidatus Limnocylindrales bacterium]